MAGYDDLNGKIWMNGQMVDWRSANVHILTHAMHYASSVFEGERAYNCLLYTSPSPRDLSTSRMPSSA